MKLSTVLVLTMAVFGAGSALGVVAARRGIPREQLRHWLALGLTRRVLRVLDPTAAGTARQEPLAEE